MTDNNLACLMVWIGYLGVIFAPIFALYGLDLGECVGLVLISLVFIWLGKRLDRSVAAFKAKTN
jgi:hypothetical protein